ncbi:hypothetical protein [Mycobacterium sp. 852002-51057_SCH5723018]|nr:hypothetical protein [Mycobacterium sp. 852002-51057_SCH5723018]
MAIASATWSAAKIAAVQRIEHPEAGRPRGIEDLAHARHAVGRRRPGR